MIIFPAIQMPVVIMEDAIIHTNEHPFCSDETCPCHTDKELFEKYIDKPSREGLLTEKEAQRLQAGK
jgi:hypothetical protein